jgi:two-component system KDP operon response regulator KdpE
MSESENQTQLSVLVIDDESQIQRLLTVALEANGHAVSAVGEGGLGIAKAAQRRFDAIILDLGLPDMNGLEVLKNLREWTQIPVIVLTVHDGESEKVDALDRGADDYVTKPFNTSELLARLRATVRRANRSQTDEPVYRFGDVEVNLASRHVLRKGEPLKLTATEYALLRLFVQHAGKVLTHQQILRQIWGPEHESQTQYLRVYILRLREKLEENPAEPVLIATEPGVGYRLVEAASA